MVQSYYGTGKGKTTAAIGAAVRCSGSGQMVLYVPLLKNGDSAEFKVLNELKNIELVFCREHYALYDNMDEERSSALSEAYSELIFEEVSQRICRCEMVVLDEVLDAVEFGYINEKAFTEILNEWKQNTEIILTGHKLPESIAKVSDYISEVREINHPYNSGIPSRKGIEY